MTCDGNDHSVIMGADRYKIGLGFDALISGAMFAAPNV